MRTLLILALAWLLPFSARGDDANLGAIARHAAPAVFTITCFSKDAKKLYTGTGFIVDESGILVTNAHVIEGAKRILVNRDKYSFFEVERVLALNAISDLALLKVRCDRLPFLKIENSMRVSQGDRVIVYGSPLGLAGTLSEGIISAVRREKRDELLQITAPISPGSSGSPVFNAKGEVVGIAVARIEGGQSLNFAIPSEALKPLFEAAGGKKFSRQLDVFDLTPRKGETQTEMNLDSIAQFNKAESEMTDIYQKVIQRYSKGSESNPSLVDRLRKAQRAWIAFRDAHIEAVFPSDGVHFSARPMCAAELQAELTRARIEQLNEWWEGIDADICAGTRPDRQ